MFSHEFHALLRAKQEKMTLGQGHHILNILQVFEVYEEMQAKIQHCIAIYCIKRIDSLLTFSILPGNTPKKHIQKNTALLPGMTPQVKPALWRLKYMNGVLMPSVTFHGEMSRSAAAAQQADSIKIGFLQRLMPCMQYATALGPQSPRPRHQECRLLSSQECSAVL